MYNNDEIMQFVYLVVEIADPDRIILFGSYAYGNPDDKSDLDLFVIKNGKTFLLMMKRNLLRLFISKGNNEKSARGIW